MKTIVECNNVERRFVRGVPVLEGVDLTVGEGSVTGLVGRNGSGKSTLMKCLLGLIKPQAGEIRVFGIDPFKDPVAVRARIGYVAETLAFPRSTTVEEIFTIHRRLYKNWDLAFERELVERFSIDRRAKFSKLSKGQAEQASLVCAIAHRPDLLLLDEPAGGLDPAARRAFIDVYVSLINRGPVTILLSSHDMIDLERICGEIAILDKGKILLKDDLARMRDEMTLAIVPDDVASQFRENDLARSAYSGRQGGGEARFVLRAPLAECQSSLAALGDSLTLQSMTLGDLFVELTGGAM